MRESTTIGNTWVWIRKKVGSKDGNKDSISMLSAARPEKGKLGCRTSMLRGIFTSC